MLNILHTKIAFADWVKENVLNKIATKIVYNRDEETYLNLEVTDNLDLKDTYFGCCTWRMLWETINKQCTGIYRIRNIRTHVTNTACGVNRY